MRKKLSLIFSVGIMVVMLVACGSTDNLTSSSNVPNGKEETFITGQIENSNGDESSIDSSVDSSVDSTSTVETTTEAPTTTAEPETTTEAPTTTVEPETTTEAPTTTVEPETTTETPTTTVEPETTTEAPTTTVEPETTTEAPDDPTPSNPGWDGDYDNLPSDGFDHIKVPTIDDFYDEGLDNPGGAFDFGNRPEWEEEWYDAYNEFLVANGSPIIDDTPIGAFYAINPGSTFINGATYQYLYYGYRGDATNGWGDIVIYPGGMYLGNSSLGDEVDNTYYFETSNFFYGEIDKGLEDEYRAASVMMLSWIVPNPQEVEKAIYDFHVDQVGNTILVKQVLEHGYGTWVQIGEVDVAVMGFDDTSQGLMFAIRAHK